jgi:rare lipoprotein A (peptidoglycan hydrolase)
VDATKMKRCVLRAYGIVRIIEVVMTCGAAVLFIADLSDAKAESGIASIYAYYGTKTASGEHTNPEALTAAHRTLAFGTRTRNQSAERTLRHCSDQ